MPEDLQHIRASLNATEVEEASLAAIRLAELNDVASIPALIQALNSKANRLRNAAAFALGELGAQEAKPELLRLLNDPSTYGNRGSLVYGLMHLDCSDALFDLAKLLLDDHFEVRQKVTMTMESVTHSANPKDLSSAIAFLKSKMISMKLKLSSEHLFDIENGLRLLKRLENGTIS